MEGAARGSFFVSFSRYCLANISSNLPQLDRFDAYYVLVDLRASAL